MTFRPINDRHAIREVVFVLGFSRPFAADEIGALVGSHERWKALLPRLSEERLAAFSVTPTGEMKQQQPDAQDVQRVSFNRYKSDGSYEWRLRSHETSLIVNCLAYTRWADVWRQSRQLLSKAVGALSDENDDKLIDSILLQYIDVFVWEGPEHKYDTTELFKKNSPLIPKSVWNRGPYWHLHQGWFRKIPEIQEARRMLERMHIDSTHEGDDVVTRMDTSMRIDLKDRIKPLSGFDGNASLIDRAFEELHRLTKDRLNEILTEAMIERIKLNA